LLNEAIVSYLNDIIYVKNGSASSKLADQESGFSNIKKKPNIQVNANVISSHYLDVYQIRHQHFIIMINGKAYYL